MSHNLIEIKNLNHSYYTHRKGEGFFNTLIDLFARNIICKQALKDVSFNIRPGEIIGLLGPNGAGKTTLLKILSGLIYPSSGSVSVMNKIPYKKDKSFLQQIGMVMGQKSQLLWDVPALDSLSIVREIYGISKKEFNDRLANFLDMLSINSLLHIPVRNLSLGERMKFELIASLIHNPQLLFLDEPTIGLDIVSQRVIRDFLKLTNRTYGTTIIITSHYVRDIEVLTNRVLIMKKGSIVKDSSLENLLQNFDPLQKIYFITENENFDLSMPFEKVSPKEYSIAFHPHNLQQVVSELAARAPLISMRTEEPSLEDAIFAIFEDEKGT